MLFFLYLFINFFKKFLLYVLLYYYFRKQDCFLKGEMFMMLHDSHKTLIYQEIDELSLDYLIKMYINYLSIFYCKEIEIDDKELEKKIKDLDEYIKKMTEVS